MNWFIVVLMMHVSPDGTVIVDKAGFRQVSYEACQVADNRNETQGEYVIVTSCHEGLIK